MPDLSHRQQKIQEKRKQTSFRDFVKDILSWYPLVLNKRNTLISLYPDTERSCPIVPHKTFLEEVDNLTKQGRNYDTQISFFENFKALFREVPFSSLYNYSGAENSDYAFSVFQAKNCYLSFAVITNCENTLYSFAVKEWCRNVINSTQINNYSENIFSSHCVVKSFNVFYSKFIENSSDIWFSSNLMNCHNCLLCDNLENKNYCIENKEYSREEFAMLKAEMLRNKNIFSHYTNTVATVGNNHGSSDIINGNFVLNSQQVENGKYCFYLKNARNVIVVGSPHENVEIYDTFEAGSMGNSHFYWALNAGVNSEHIYNCEGIVTCHNVYYSRFLENCKFCLWCIGLRNQEYCILNKQYSKEERHEKVNQIFEQMEKDWTLWQFFPGTMNPFYFNDTIAHLIDTSFTKEEVEKAGYLRRDEPIKVDIPADAELVSVRDLDKYEGYDENGKRYINDEILKKVIIDEQGNVRRIVNMEYVFLVKNGLPLPRKHRLERMKENFRIEYVE